MFSNICNKSRDKTEETQLFGPCCSDRLVKGENCLLSAIEKNLLLENCSKYFDDFLSGERSLPFGLLVYCFIKLIESSAFVKSVIASDIIRTLRFKIDEMEKKLMHTKAKSCP